MTHRLSRRALLSHGTRLAAGAVALSALGGAPRLSFARDTVGNVNYERATALYDAMQRYFYLPEQKLYRETQPQTGYPYSYLWSFTEAMAATIDLAGLSGEYEPAVEDRRAGLEAYWQERPDAGAAYSSYVGPPLGHAGDRYYDDNNWVGRALLQLCRMGARRDESALRRAGQIFEFIAAGWDQTPTHVPPGGIFWVEAAWNRDRGTGPTAGGAKLALHLFELTGAAGYRDWGVRLYEWTHRHLFDRRSRLYWDRFTDGRGTIFKEHWSYAQGLMIAAGVQMHRLTGDSSYIGRAERVASATLDTLRRRGYSSQPAIFNVLFFRNLLLLYAVDRRAAYLEAMRSYAETLWNDRAQHDPATHLYKDPYDWAHTPTHLLLDQAAMVQLYACLAWADAGKNLRELA